MKILQTARWFFPHVGGASTRVYETAKNLASSGHKVHLLVHNPKSIEQCNLPNNAPAYEEYEGIHVYRLPYFPPKTLYWAASIPLMTAKAASIIRKEKIDVILSHNPPYLVGASSLLASKLTGVPFYVNAHDVWGASHYSGLQSKIGLFLEKTCIQRAEKIFVPCRGLDEVLMKRTSLPKKRFIVAPTGVDTDEYRPLKVEENIDALFVGNLAPWSGGEYFVKAANRLLEKDPRLRFQVVGDGLQRHFLETIGDKRIEFVGAVAKEKLPRIINQAKVCVSSFPKPETVCRDTPLRPISTLEFMACGKPVIISDVPGAGDVVEDGISGLLAKPEDVDDLTRRIRGLLDDPAGRAKIGKKAREIALKNTWADTTRIIEKTIAGG